MGYKTVFTTERAEVHQQKALEAAPDNLDITMLRDPDTATLKNALNDAEFFISERRGVIDAELLDSANKLQLILRLGSQTFDIDTKACREQGIKVVFEPVGSVIRVAEHTILQMLALVKRLREAQRIALETSPDWKPSQRTDENTFSYNWSNRENIQGLWRKKIGILGFGEIGMEVARRLIGWYCDVHYYKRTRLPEEVEQMLNLTYTDAETIFQTSDFVVNLLPYSDSTDNFINAQRINMMKPDAYIVSTGSGSIVDEQALASAIESGQIAGAALDTYEYEPIKADNPLLNLARADYNVLLTPHIAAGSIPNAEERRAQYDNILRYIDGKPLFNQLV